MKQIILATSPALTKDSLLNAIKWIQSEKNITILYVSKERWADALEITNNKPKFWQIFHNQKKWLELVVPDIDKNLENGEWYIMNKNGIVYSKGDNTASYKEKLPTKLEF
ncbi:MAG: hypothetical protein AAB456_00105 [Patescibacteria group bacterium]